LFEQGGDFSKVDYSVTKARLPRVPGESDGGDVTLEINPQRPVTDESVNLTAAVPEDVSPTGFSWTFGDGSSAQTDSNSVVHTYTAAGLYTVDLTVMTESRGDLSASTSLAVYNSAEFIKTDPEAALAGEEVTLTADLPKDYDPAGVSWVLGDGTRKTGETITHTYQYSDTFDIEAFLVTSSINVLDREELFVGDISLMFPNTGAIGQELQFTTEVAPIYTPTSYRWTLGDESEPVEGPDVTTVTHTYDEAGTYRVRVEAETEEAGIFVSSGEVEVGDIQSG
jgi:PKD repeat protein